MLKSVAVCVVALSSACHSNPDPSGGGAGGQTSTLAITASTTSQTTVAQTGSSTQSTVASSSTGMLDPGPNVDRTDPQLYENRFTAQDADAAATTALGDELTALDTRVEPRGLLVVYLHGAGAPTTCGSQEHGRVLAALGFHVMSPCYVSDYGVGNCGADIEGCRLEAFEGVDHHPFVGIAPPDSIETRVLRGLTYANTINPQGDWTYFTAGDKPRWDKIVISGISHGASSSGVIGIHRLVNRVVMLSGPLDTNQAWLTKAPITPMDRFWGFTHTGDGQHPGHLAAFDSMALAGTPTTVDGATAPYGMSHRLVSSAATPDGHGATQAGGSSPKSGGDYLFLPVWQTLYALP